MSTRNPQATWSVAAFPDGAGVWEKLDQLARATIGIPALEFVEGYAAGKFARVPIATDLAALIPFARRPD